MLETVLGLYCVAMAGEVRTPIPHLVGPPGSGKSTIVETAARMIGVDVHTINVSRISPLDLEGVQMPSEGQLVMMLATYWTKLKDGDILFLDEFLRGFPEVYNGFIDILTSRTVAGHKLPKVFIIAASNSRISPDAALNDRLLHINMPDPRHTKAERTRLINDLIDQMGLLPDIADSDEMDKLLEEVIYPPYSMFDKASTSVVNDSGLSPRNLIGQVQLRYVTNTLLAELLEANNVLAQQTSKPQYIQVFKSNGRLVRGNTYMDLIEPIRGSDKLTERQKKNIEINVMLCEAELEKKGATP